MGLQSIDSKRDYFTALLMFEIKNEIAPGRLINLFVNSGDACETSIRSPADKSRNQIMNFIETP